SSDLPDFEKAFLGFKPAKLAFQPDEFWAFSRTDMILAPLRTMRLSFISASQNSSGWNASLAGLKPRKAFSKSGHLFSITLQAKPAQNTRFVISARMRSSPSLASALASGLSGRSLASCFGPPLRFSALARMVLNEIMRQPRCDLWRGQQT